MKITILFCIQILAFVCFAKSKPDWTTESTKADSQYKYYVGRASNVPNESSSISQATKDAYEQAHRENFGSEVQINSETYQTNNSATSVARISEKSKTAKFEDFEQVDFHFEKNDQGRFDSWVLYKFSIKAIANEKRRLENIKDSLVEKTIFSTQGLTQDQEKGILQVTTEPQGAVIFIDGERFGKTPIQLNGQIDEGKHKIRIDHNQYETIEEDFIIGRNQTITLNKTLIKSAGTISISVDVPNANVIINGHPVGLTPIADFKVEAGVKHKIEITHAETEKYSQEFDVSKGSVRALNLLLPKKPAYLSVSSNPVDAEIELDGDKLKLPLEKRMIKPGAHNIVIKKDGFLVYKDEIDLRGGENKVIPVIKLESLSEAQIRINESPWILSPSIGLSTSPVIGIDKSFLIFEIAFEKKLFTHLGAGFKIQSGSFDATKKYEETGPSNSTEIYTSKGSFKNLSLYLPIYLFDNYSINPEAGTTNISLTNTTRKYTTIGYGNDGASTDQSSKLKFYGLSFKYFRNSKESSFNWFTEIGIKNYQTDEGLSKTAEDLKFGCYIKF